DQFLDFALAPGVRQWGCGGRGAFGPAKAWQIQSLADQLANGRLLCFNQLVSIEHHKIEFGAHGQVLLKNAALENAEALVRIGREPQVHAGLEVLELRSAIENSLERDLQ